MYYDMHVHSIYSKDSVLSFSGALQDALDKGLSGLCITDHLDLGFPTEEEKYQFDISAYFQSLQKLRQEAPKDFTVLSGIEFGIDEGVLAETEARIQPYSFDFILGSTHLVQGEDPYDQIYFERQSIKDAYSLYLQEISKNIRIYLNFDVLGHFDYLVRYAPYPDRAMRYAEYADQLDDIFRWLIAHGKGLEINTSTYQKVPLDPNALLRYRELGGEIITLGSDAHTPNTVGRIFTQHLAVLQDCGFRYVAHYRERKPYFTKIVV